MLLIAADCCCCASAAASLLPPCPRLLCILPRALTAAPTVYPAPCPKVPRSITYDSKLQKLLAAPVEEMKLLRGTVLGSHTNAAVAAGGALDLMSSAASSPQGVAAPAPTTSYDVEAAVALPKGAATRFGAAILAANKSTARIFLEVNVSAPDATTGYRAVNMTASIPHAKAGVNTTMSFALPDADSFELRILADRTIVEIFGGGGRGVVSMPAATSPAGGTAPAMASVFLFGIDGGITVATATAYGKLHTGPPP